MGTRTSVLAATVLWAAAASAAHGGQATDWDEQNRAMLYLIMDLLSINAINGINLTLDQAVKLKTLARQVRAASPQEPDLKARFRPDLSEVRDVYVEARDTLLAGREPSEGLQKAVARARGIEAAVLRLSLAKPGASGQGCGRCHGQPDVGDVRGTAEIKAALEKSAGPRPPQRETFLAHEGGLVGKDGLLKLALLAPQVDAILTPEQKQVLDSFTCCLLPPKSLSDPVRAGQAASGEKEIAIFRYVRGVPAAKWAVVKAGSLDLWRAGLVARSPDVASDEMARATERVGKIYEEARGLSDTDFEMAKDTLAARLQEVSKPSKTLDDRERRFSQAMFLIGAGTVEAYEWLIRRLNAVEKREK